MQLKTKFKVFKQIISFTIKYLQHLVNLYFNPFLSYKATKYTYQPLIKILRKRVKLSPLSHFVVLPDVKCVVQLLGFTAL